MIRYICLSLLVCLCFACGSQTKVILLPDQDGITGQAVVMNPSSQTTLDTPYTSAEVADETAQVTQHSVDQKAVEDEYQTLFAAEPLRPVSFILYFQNDSTSLTIASLRLIPKIVETAKRREPSIVSIIGHTDSKGKDEYNTVLAMDRANAMASLLNKSGVTLKNMVIRSHGENDPLINTGDNVSEVRNRRVEIMIR